MITTDWLEGCFVLASRVRSLASSTVFMRADLDIERVKLPIGTVSAFSCTFELRALAGAETRQQQSESFHQNLSSRSVYTANSLRIRARRNWFCLRFCVKCGIPRWSASTCDFFCVLFGFWRFVWRNYRIKSLFELPIWKRFSALWKCSDTLKNTNATLRNDSTIQEECLNSSNCSKKWGHSLESCPPPPATFQLTCAFNRSLELADWRFEVIETVVVVST